MTIKHPIGIQPIENETLYSIFTRYCLLTGVHPKTIFKNKSSKNIIVIEKLNIEIAEFLTAITGLSKHELLKNHSLLPYYYPFHWKRSLISANNEISRYYKNIQNNHYHFCPKCCIENVKRHGFTFWDRCHQLPFVKHCYKHKIKLIDIDTLPHKITLPPTNQIDTEAVTLSNFEIELIKTGINLLNFKYPYQGIQKIRLFINSYLQHIKYLHLAGWKIEEGWTRKKGYFERFNYVETSWMAKEIISHYKYVLGESVFREYIPTNWLTEKKRKFPELINCWISNNLSYYHPHNIILFAICFFDNFDNFFKIMNNLNLDSSNLRLAKKKVIQRDDAYFIEQYIDTASKSFSLPTVKFKNIETHKVIRNEILKKNIPLFRSPNHENNFI